MGKKKSIRLNQKYLMKQYDDILKSKISHWLGINQINKNIIKNSKILVFQLI
jgi:hypothetical protein